MSNKIIILGNFGNSDNSALQKDFQAKEILDLAKKNHNNLKIGFVNFKISISMMSLEMSVLL